MSPVLRIRHAQLQHLGENATAAFADACLDGLQRLHPALPGAYLRDLIALSLQTCMPAGFDRQAQLRAFMADLLQDDAHPLPAPALRDKAARLLRDLHTEARYTRLQALAAAGHAQPAAGGH